MVEWQRVTRRPRENKRYLVYVYFPRLKTHVISVSGFRNGDFVANSILGGIVTHWADVNLPEIDKDSVIDGLAEIVFNNDRIAHMNSTEIKKIKESKDDTGEPV